MFDRTTADPNKMGGVPQQTQRSCSPIVLIGPVSFNGSGTSIPTDALGDPICAIEHVGSTAIEAICSAFVERILDAAEAEGKIQGP